MIGKEKDKRGEKALGLFLDKYFYPQLAVEESFSSIERIYAAAEQKLGIDLIIRNDQGGSLKVDEKAQLRYINRPTNTFAFELSFFHTESGTLLDGWFVSEKNVTDCYILCWVNGAQTDQLNRITAEDFEEVEICLITKKRLQDYLNRNRITNAYLKKMGGILRDNPESDRFELFNGAYLKQSDTEDGENPINLVLSKRLIEALAYRRYLVTKESVSRI